MELPNAPVERLLKRSHLRVSQDAVNEFNKLLEEIIADLAAEADTISKSARRKTVSGYDVRLAKRNIL